jgi:hypothetical protein
MGLFSKPGKHLKSAPSWPKPADSGDERYPGLAGYTGVGLKKNAMPENRFNYVAPRPEKKKNEGWAEPPLSG